jgi:hypothetical protein
VAAKWKLRPDITLVDAVNPSANRYYAIEKNRHPPSTAPLWSEHEKSSQEGCSLVGESEDRLCMAQGQVPAPRILPGGGVTRDDDSHDASTAVVLIRLYKDEVAMRTGYHHLCSPEIPDSDGLVEVSISSDCHVVCGGGNLTKNMERGVFRCETNLWCDWLWLSDLRVVPVIVGKGECDQEGIARVWNRAGVKLGGSCKQVEAPAM